MTRLAALLLTVATGFSGLSYEVAWERYLATLLGSHSEATASVLGIFLGGLSVGYWVFGRVTRRLVERGEAAGRPPRLLVVYGLVEGGIGIYVFLFPYLFRGVQALSLWVPHGSAGLGFAFDVTLAALLIGPPTVLMGGTIPILTQALARSLADATRFHAFVYAFNTAGAFVGALAAGFFLIPELGLVRVMYAMGAINVGAGAIFLSLGWRRRTEVAGANGIPGRLQGLARCAAVALLVGFAMMAVQTILIRIGGLAFGSSQFTFSMVVAVFVLCIALGSFLVSVLPRIPSWLLPASLWVLVLALYQLYGTLENAPYWAHALRALFRDQEQAFLPYYFSAFLGLLAVAGPPVIVSGATLPLLFDRLRRESEQLGANAGILYSWNTVGSFLGAVLGGYALLFWLDLHHVYRIAVAAIALAALLLTRLPASAAWRSGAVAALTAAVLGVLLLLGPWESERLSAGLFRQRQPIASTYLGPDAHFERTKVPTIFYDDDPTTSVAVTETPIAGGEVGRSIITNGKPDGSTHGDLKSMVLLAVLPALFAEEPERFFLIGWGTGISTGALAKLDSTREVVVAEISQGVLDAAPLFDFANWNASRSPKVRAIRSDAYRALLRSQGSYDAIISMPPNPWVTGVEMLFSREFLEASRDLLTPRGVYAQWFHQYETNSESVALVFRTYAEVFGHVAVWYAQGPDLLLLGFKDPTLALDVGRLERRATRPDFADALRSAGITSFPALLASELLPLGVVNAAKLPGPIHTLYHPRLNAEAARGFFSGAHGALPFTGYGEAARVGFTHSLLRRYAALHGGRLSEAQRAEVVSRVCTSRALECAAFLAQWTAEQPDSEAASRALVRARTEHPAFAQAVGPTNLRVLRQLFALDGRMDPIPLSEANRATALFKSCYAHNAPFPAQGLLRIWRRCQSTGGQNAACRRGLQNAQALVAGREFHPAQAGSAVGIGKKNKRAQVPQGEAAAPMP